MMDLKGQYRPGRQPDRHSAGEYLRVPLGLKVEVPLPLIPALSERQQTPPTNLTQLQTD